MALKKSQLYASLWQSCDELRGGMDAYEYLMRHFATESGKSKAKLARPIFSDASFDRAINGCQRLLNPDKGR